MTASQNVLFVGESPADNAYDHPPGAGIARLIERSLCDHGYRTHEIDNWRDCGWSIDLCIEDGKFEIVLASTAEANLWLLQIACINEPGILGRLFGKRTVDHSDDVYRISCAVHDLLQANGYTDLQWCLGGYPSDSESTSEPSHEHEQAP